VDTKVAFYERVLDTPSRREEILAAVGHMTPANALKNGKAAIRRELDRLSALIDKADEDGPHA